MARATLRDDLHQVHAQLTLDALAASPRDATAAERVAAWEERDSALVCRTRATLGEIVEGDVADLARLSVGLRVVRPGCCLPPADLAPPTPASGGRGPPEAPRRPGSGRGQPLAGSGQPCNNPRATCGEKGPIEGAEVRAPRGAGKT